MYFFCVCCRFDDFDDAIDEAIEEDIRDLCGGEWRICSLIQWWVSVGCSFDRHTGYSGTCVVTSKVLA